MEAPIKYCIWDVGKVIYDFSFQPLDVFCQAKTTNLELYKQRRGLLDYDDYMKGKISFEEWCQNLCEFYCLPFTMTSAEEINLAMHEGVSPIFEVTRYLMQEMPTRGIGNCILSNALPNLADTGNLENLVKPEHLFCSFDIGLLKPDAAIYEYVRAKLGCEFEDLIFVDDKTENVKSAAKLGIHSILFNKMTIADELHYVLKG